MSTQPPSPSDETSVTLDRLIGALSPGLSVELGKLLAEQRQRMEAETTIRIRKALLDRETELRAESRTEQEKVREQTGERVRQEVTRQLEDQFEKKLSAELRALKERLDEVSAQSAAIWEEERSGLGAEVERWRVLADFYRRTGTSISQADILKRFLKAGTHFAGGIALYLNRSEGLSRWGAEGDLQAFPELVSEGTKDPEWFWVPIVVRSRMIVAVAARDVVSPEALEALTGGLKRAIENLGLRLGSGATDPDAGTGNGESREPSHRQGEPGI